MLYDVVGAVMLSDRRIVVANRGTSELLFFDPAGSFLFSTGSRGDGPGAFRRLAAIGVGSGDTIFTYDDWAGRISIFDAAGTLVRTSPLDIASALPQAFALGPGLQAAGWTASGVLIAFRRESGSLLSGQDTSVESEDRVPRSTTNGESIRFSQPAVELVFFDRDGRLVSRTGKLPGSESLSVSRVEDRRTGEGSGSVSVTSSRLQVPFLKTFQVTAAWGAVAFGNTDAYKIRVSDPNGDVIHTVIGARPIRRVTTDDRNAWIRRQLSAISDPILRERRKRLYEGIDFPATMPAFASLVLQEGGVLWVEDFDSGPPQSRHTRWSVYDPLGKHLGKVSLPTRFRPMSIGSGYVLGVWKDPLDVEYVRLYDLELPDG